MDYGALQSLTRIHFPEFSTNPRLAKTNHILRELSYELNNLDRFLLKSPVGSLGRFTFGPLGIVEHKKPISIFRQRTDQPWIIREIYRFDSNP